MVQHRHKAMHGRTYTPPDAGSLPDLALSANEAAAVMGVHWTRPRKMADAGLLMCKALRPAFNPDSERSTRIYSLHDCESDYRNYLALRQNRDPSIRRPRAHLDNREEMLRRLAEVEPILFKDACGSGEAAEILRVTPCLVLRYAEDGVLRARKPIDDLRGHGDSTGRWWIFSASSVRARRDQVIAEEAADKKRGLRKFIDPLDN